MSRPPQTSAPQPQPVELEELEEGQIPPTYTIIGEELEEGQVPPHALHQTAVHLQTSFDDRRSDGALDDELHSASESDADAAMHALDEERELAMLLADEEQPLPASSVFIDAAARAPPSFAAASSADAVCPPLLHVVAPSEHSDPAPVSASLWSLPLPARSMPADASSASPLAALRARLLDLGLPAVHIHSVLSQRADADARDDVAAVPLDCWVDRVMDAMYRAQDGARSMPLAALPPMTAAPLLTDVPLPRSATALAPPSDTVVSAGAPTAASAAAVCGICWDPIPPSAADAQLSASPCHHEFCAPCWNGYLSSKVLDGNVLKLRCPHAHPSPCDRLLPAEEVKRRLSTAVMRAKYERLAELARVAQDPSLRWCPTPNCESVLRGGSAAHPRLQCAKCSAQLCFRCSERWHPGVECAAASAASLSQLLSGGPSLSQSLGLGSPSHPDEIKSCPNCSMGIIRASGCNFLRCSRCSFEFCWICLGEYSDSHFAWWNLRGCPLLHLDRFSWLADDSCCGIGCACGCGCAGVIKRTALRGLLALVYLLAFLLALPFLLLLSPYLLFRHWRDRDLRARRRELKHRNKQMARAQLPRAGLAPNPQPDTAV